MYYLSANYVISKKNEKILVLVKKVPNEKEQIMVIVIWDAINEKMATYSFQKLKEILGPHGIHQARGCEFNSQINCTCQGVDKQGASISLGCSFQGHVNACKFKVHMFIILTLFISMPQKLLCESLNVFLVKNILSKIHI